MNGTSLFLDRVTSTLSPSYPLILSSVPKNYYFNICWSYEVGVCRTEELRGVPFILNGVDVGGQSEVHRLLCVYYEVAYSLPFEASPLNIWAIHCSGIVYC